MYAKVLLKETLQAEVGLPVDRNILVIGLIGRLEEQKGSEISLFHQKECSDHSLGKHQTLEFLLRLHRRVSILLFQ